VIGDVWGSILLFYIQNLFSTRNSLLNQGAGYDSDDSEVYELGLKSTGEMIQQQPLVGRRKSQEVRRKSQLPADVEAFQDLEDNDDIDDDDDEDDDEDDSSLESPEKNEDLMKAAFQDALEDDPPVATNAFGSNIEASTGASKDQFATTRKFSIDKVRSFNNDDYTEHQESRLMLDGSTMTGESFMNAWNAIEEIRELNCGFSLPASVNVDKLKTSDISPFVKYIRSIGLTIIATGR
jgi:hypothetical protein